MVSSTLRISNVMLPLASESERVPQLLTDHSSQLAYPLACYAKEAAKWCGTCKQPIDGEACFHLHLFHSTDEERSEASLEYSE